MNACYSVWFYRDPGDSNSRPHAYMASSLATEPPQTPLIKFLFMSLPDL